MKDIKKDSLFTEITDQEAACVSGGGFLGKPWDQLVSRGLSKVNPWLGPLYGSAGVIYDLYRLNNGTYSDIENAKFRSREKNGGRLVAGGDYVPGSPIAVVSISAD